MKKEEISAVILNLNIVYYDSCYCKLTINRVARKYANKILCKKVL